jgi:hypothetical protein
VSDDQGGTPPEFEGGLPPATCSEFASAPAAWGLPYDVDTTDTIAEGMPGHDAHATVDIDGDGVLDLVVTMDPANTGSAFGGAASPHWEVYLGLGSGFATTANDWALPANLIALAHTPGSSTDADAHVTVDIDGDGVLDLVVTMDPTNAGNAFRGDGSAPYWEAYLGTGSGFASTATDWSLPGNFSLASHVPASATDTDAHTTVDIDGDGLLDLVQTMDPMSVGNAFGGTTAPHWQVYLGTGSGFADAPTNWNLPANLTDLTHMPAQSTGGDAHATVDIDGDGRPDLVISADPTNPGNAFGGSSSPHWQVYRGTASGFGATPIAWSLPANLSVLSHTPADATDTDAHTTVDMDGDAILDLVVTMDPANPGNAFGAGGAPYWQVYTGTATGFATATSSWKLPSNISVLSHSPASSADGDAHTTVDVTGVGCPDLLVTMDPANVGHAFPGPSWHVFRAQ